MPENLTSESRAVLDWLVENGLYDALHGLVDGRREYVAACALVALVDQELSSSESDPKYPRVKAWLETVEHAEAAALALSVQADPVEYCDLCERPSPRSHLHVVDGGRWYGDCCWDERLRN